MVTAGVAGRAPRPWRGAIAGLLVALAGCAPPAAPPREPAAPPPPPVATAPAAPASIDPDPLAEARIKADVEYLASPALAGRGTGDPGAELAAAFIAQRFAELELEPLGGSGEDAKGYQQAFEARVGADVAPPSLGVQRAGRKQSVDAARVVTADGSASGTVSGAAVFVGHGVTAAALSWDDYGGRDIEGKIAIVLDGVPTLSSTAVAAHAGPLSGAAHGEGAHGGAPPSGAAHGGAPPSGAAHGGAPPVPAADVLRDFGSIRYKLRTAREHKAAGVVLVAAGDELPSVSNEAASMGIPAVVISRSAARELFPAAGITPPAKPGAPKPAAKQGAVKAPGPKPLAGVTVEITTRVTPRMATASNVVGLLRARDGSPHAGEYVIVGAHYDHLGHGGTSSSLAPGSRAIHPGADDNASGTAMLLEVARRFSALPVRPDRNVLFIAFGAEELGTIGSRHFVEHPPAPLATMKPVVGMINADMVGRMRDDKLLVDGIGTSPGWKPIVEDAARGLGLALQYGVEGFGASDHASFTAARVPIAFLFTGVHEDYHRPSDTADKINASGVARSAVLAARMALSLAQRDERLAFTDAPSDPHRGRRGGFRASLGTLPDYAYQGPGVRITGVRPDAPAARAGLQAGDVIVRIGTHAITNIHDFMFSLGDLEPGRPIEMEVDRGGTRVPIRIIPAPGR